MIRHPLPLHEVPTIEGETPGKEDQDYGGENYPLHFFFLFFRRCRFSFLAASLRRTSPVFTYPP